MKADREAADDRHRAQRVGGPGGHRHADERARQRDQQALDEQQADDSETARADREADADLALPRGRAREEQVGRVAAYGEQEQQHDRLQQREGPGEHALRAARRLPEGQRFGAHPAVRLRIETREIAHRGVELRLRRVAADAVGEAAEHRVAAQRTIVELRRSREQLRRHRRRRPHVEVEPEDRPLESRGRDADHREHAIVDAHRAADNRRIAAEPRLPVVVPDDEHRLAAGTRDLVGADQTAERGAQPERAEIIAGDEQAVGALHLSRRADGQRRHAKRDRIGKRAQPLAQVAVFTPRHAGIGPGIGQRLDEKQAARMRDAGQRPQHDALHPREDRGVHADAHADRRDDDGGDDRHARDRAPRVANVAEHQRPPCSGAIASAFDPRGRCM